MDAPRFEAPTMARPGPGSLRGARERQPSEPGETRGAIPREAPEKLVQFVHPEKEFGYSLGLDEALLAALYGLDLASYRAIKGRFDANARQAAQELLADPTFAVRVDQLPFRIQPVRPSDPVVDIQAVFGYPAPPELALSDGIHPSLAGQTLITRALVECLTS